MNWIKKTTTGSDFSPYIIKHSNAQDKNIIFFSYQSPSTGQSTTQPVIDWITGVNEFPVYKEIVSETIHSLLDKIDFLGYQLSYQLGLVPENDFKEIKNKYLQPQIKYNIEELANKIWYLYKITGIDFDEENLSLLFRCDIETAHKALSSFLDSNELHA